MNASDIQASLIMVADALKKIMGKFTETINRLDDLDKRVQKIEAVIASDAIAGQQQRVADLEHRMEYAETLVLADEDMFMSEKTVAQDIKSGRYRPFDRA